MTKQTYKYLIKNGNKSVIIAEAIHSMIPLYMLWMNPHASAETIAALLDVNVVAIQLREDVARLCKILQCL